MGDMYNAFCVVWVTGSPEGWGRLAGALTGGVEVGGYLLAILGLIIGTWECMGREDTAK